MSKNKIKKTWNRVKEPHRISLSFKGGGIYEW